MTLMLRAEPSGPQQPDPVATARRLNPHLPTQSKNYTQGGDKITRTKYNYTSIKRQYRVPL